MSETVMLGLGGSINKIPRKLWEVEVGIEAFALKKKLGFMTDEHHLVRNFIVREMPRLGVAITPTTLAEELTIPLARIEEILDEMEKNLFFLVRNEQGAVSWAYPVTVEPTPHKLIFSTGEKIFGACAVDVIATPFVQGRLRQQSLTVSVSTRCALTDRPIEFTLDHEFGYKSGDPEVQPLIFLPYINWLTFDDPNILQEF